MIGSSHDPKLTAPRNGWGSWAARVTNGDLSDGNGGRSGDWLGEVEDISPLCSFLSTSFCLSSRLQRPLLSRTPRGGNQQIHSCGIFQVKDTTSGNSGAKCVLGVHRRATVASKGIIRAKPTTIAAMAGIRCGNLFISVGNPGTVPKRWIARKDRSPREVLSCMQANSMPRNGKGIISCRALLTCRWTRAV